jgi:hypothetical protein
MTVLARTSSNLPEQIRKKTPRRPFVYGRKKTETDSVTAC